MTIAYNKETDEALYLDGSGAWKPAKIAKNPQTGERLAFDGAEWKPIPSITASAGGQSAPQKQPTRAEQFGTIGPERPLSMGEVASGAISNFPESAGRLAKDVAQPFLHPIETAKSMYSLGKGILQKLIPGEQADEATADAVGKFFVDRYGGWDEIKRTLAEDPAGAMADLSVVLTGGGTAIARAPGVVGKAGKAVKAAGQAIDPMQAAVKGAKMGAKGGSAVAGELIGKSTGAEGRSLAEAFKAGRTGDKVFRDYFTGKRGGEDLANEAKQALRNMRETKQGGYVAAEGAWMQDKTPIPFDPIVEEFFKLDDSMKHRGKSKVSKETRRVVDEIGEVLTEWSDDVGAHDAAGLDALKQRLDDIRIPPDNEQAQRAVTSVRNRVKKEIVDAVPEYAEAMRKYEEMHTLEKEIERALSLQNKTSIDTSLRKLQSVMRDNAQTNYGNRTRLAGELEAYGGEGIFPGLAGQSLSKWTPRGLQGAVGVGLGGGSFANPYLAASLPFMSPKMMGGAAYGAGAATRLADQLRLGLGVSPGAGQAYFQTGRLAEELKRRR